MAKDLTALFSPKSVVIIGASRHPEKVGAIVLKNIISSKFYGKIFLVNPNAESIENIKSYKEISELPQVPDLAIIALPAPVVLETINQIGEKGIKNAVVFAAGFKEIGTEGEKLENDLIQAAQKYGINILGPNCLGFINNLAPINATFGESISKSGNLRFISQSGAIAASIFDWCASSELNFSEFVTLGNKATINENDVLEYFLNNPITSNSPGLSSVTPIGLYLESISDGPRFIEIASQISKTAPVFMLKPGKTQAAARAMQSHTGAIAGEDSILEAALKQAGVQRCETLEDFFDLAKAFAWENSPKGPRVAIVSNAGGPAVISADAVVGSGLELANLSDSTKKLLAKVLPNSASIVNPVDVLGDALAKRFAAAAEIILQTDQADALVVILTPQVMTQIEVTAQKLGELSKKYQKPILCSFIGGSKVAEGEKKLNEYKIPNFRFPERAISAIAVMYNFTQQKDRLEKKNDSQVLLLETDITRVKNIINQAQKNNQKTLDNVQSNEILSAVDIHTPPTAIIADFEQAKYFAIKHKFPVVLKLSSPGLLHKKEVGGVITDIGNEDQLEVAFDKLKHKITHLDKDIQKSVQIQIQKDVTEGVEVIVGIKKDPTFGSVLLFGAGGSLAEIINDRNLHLLPLNIDEVRNLVEKSKIYSQLAGDENEPALALDKLYDLILRLGKLAEILPEVTDIEINPVIITLNNTWAVDGKVILSSGQTQTSTAPAFKTATTTSYEILAGKIHHITFKTDQPLTFLPGQYINVKVASDRINCYSIATNDKENEFSLLVDTSPGGPGSKFFDNLKVEDKITYLGPFGKFTLQPKDGAKHLLFLATGSGLAPLRSQIDSLLKEQNCKLPITLYLGLASSNDVFWQDYFKQLTKEHPNFKFKITIDKPEKEWKGDVGFITELIKKNISDTSNYSAYLCGNKYMIADATKILVERGIPAGRIYTEKL